MLLTILVILLLCLILEPCAWSLAPVHPWELVLPIWVTAVGLASGKQAVRADFDDEVHAVFAVDGRFCTVGELVRVRL
jgi:hypothetical protein